MAIARQRSIMARALVFSQALEGFRWVSIVRHASPPVLAPTVLNHEEGNKKGHPLTERATRCSGRRSLPVVAPSIAYSSVWCQYFCRCNNSYHLAGAQPQKQGNLTARLLGGSLAVGRGVGPMPGYL